jgi:hypothetical protein
MIISFTNFDDLAENVKRKRTVDLMHFSDMLYRYLEVVIRTVRSLWESVYRVY